MLWKIYFWTYGVLVFLTSIIVVIDLKHLRLPDLAETLIYLIGIVGVFSLAHRKKVLSYNFWSIFFWIYIGWWILNLADVLGVIYLPNYLTPSRGTEDAGLLFGLILSIPVFYALNKLRHQKS